MSLGFNKKLDTSEQCPHIRCFGDVDNIQSIPRLEFSHRLRVAVPGDHLRSRRGSVCLHARTPEGEDVRLGGVETVVVPRGHGIGGIAVPTDHDGPLYLGYCRGTQALRCTEGPS